MLASKRSIIVYPYRDPAAGVQPQLPACRAWRVVARKAADFAAGVPAVVAGLAAAAPAGAADGAYPVWVRLTDPATGTPAPNGGGGVVLVDGDGWNLAPTGSGWTIESVSAAGTAGDRFTYAVEVVQDIAECGQVNGGSAAGATAPNFADEMLWDLAAGTTVPTTVTQGFQTRTIVPPTWAETLHFIAYVNGNAANYGLNVFLYERDAAGNEYGGALHLQQGGTPWNMSLITVPTTSTVDHMGAIGGALYAGATAATGASTPGAVLHKAPYTQVAVPLARSYRATLVGVTGACTINPGTAIRILARYARR